MSCVHHIDCKTCIVFPKSPYMQVSQTLQLFDSLLYLHQDVSTSTSTLTGACEELMAEKASLVEFAGGGDEDGRKDGRKEGSL